MATAQAFADRIRYSDSLVKQLGEVLRVSLGHSKGGLNVEPRPPERERGDHYFCGFQFAGGGNHQRYVQPDARGSEWVLAKAIKKGAARASTWVGARVRFDREGESDYLVSCSLLVLANKTAPYPLIRAEWDYRGLTDRRHAQPHWHTLTALQASAVPGFQATPRHFEPSTEANVEEVESLHLAMATDWVSATGTRHVSDIADEKTLLNWIRQTTVYAIDQVQYALNKSSGQITEPAAFQG